MTLIINSKVGFRRRYVCDQDELLNVTQKRLDRIEYVCQRRDNNWRSNDICRRKDD